MALGRIGFMNILIERRGYKSYLEIGCRFGKTIKGIKCERRVGVDPEPPRETPDFERHVETSDSYFCQSRETFDLIFIDGLHHEEQVLRDVAWAMQRLNSGGTIVMHDCNPKTEQAQFVPSPGGIAWNGDVWKAIVKLRMSVGLFVLTLMTDSGLGIVRPDPEAPAYFSRVPDSKLTWDWLCENRSGALGLVEWKDIEEVL